MKHTTFHIKGFFTKRALAFGLAATLCLATLTACGQKQSFAEFTNSIFLDEVTANTINLHYTIEDPKAYGIDKYDICLGGYSSESTTDYANGLKKTKLELLTYPYTQLTTEEQLTYDLLSDYLDTQIALSSFTLYDEPLSYSNGMQLQLPILLAEYEFNSKQDVTDYLELIRLVDDYLASVIVFEKEKAQKGLFMSDELCERVIDSCEAFLENQENHYMLSTFENRLQNLNLSDKEKAKYIQTNQTIFENEITPAYELLIEELRELLGSGTNDGGVCNLPDGKRYYELLVYAETGCDDSIEDIYNRIELQRMYDLLICADLQEQDPDIIDAIINLDWNTQDEYKMLDLLQEEMLSDFPAAPTTNYTIHYVDPALQEYLAPAFYLIAPIDNYEDNAIYINDANQDSDIYYFTTLAHEGFPGHLYQTVMSYEYDLLPIRSILNYSGYVEGWATYVEYLSYYYSNIDDDVATYLARNQSATLSLYATSDIGLHYMGWSAEDMYNFWASYGIDDIDTINEITQLILSEPGNYLKYYVGYLGFLDLQAYAKELLGSDYSMTEFHRTILDIGPAPFSILEKYFEKYYSSPQT